MIQTTSYVVTNADADSFWVGDNLQDGSFVQFGFLIQTSRYYCLRGAESGNGSSCTGQVGNIENGDARWFWEYWPNWNGNEFDYGIGPQGSAGGNGTWHTYTMKPNSVGDWSFVLDNTTVDTLSFQVVKSKDPTFVVAEETTGLPSPSGQLGPVEFKNLSYLKPDGWHGVLSLLAITECGGPNPNCGIAIPYGVTVTGDQLITAGAGLTQRTSGQLLWITNFTLQVIAPPEVNVTIDGKAYGPGTVHVYMPEGNHTISVSSQIQVDGSDRLMFEGWSDGVQDSNRTVGLFGDVTLNTTYVRQYLLTVDPPSASGGGWYNEGATANFSAPPTTNFQGWYESGNLVTASPNGSIVMNGPHVLDANSAPNYTTSYIVPATLVAALAVGILAHTFFRRRKAQLKSAAS
jgi:hypothetical protein